MVRASTVRANWPCTSLGINSDVTKFSAELYIGENHRSQDVFSLAPCDAARHRLLILICQVLFRHVIDIYAGWV